MKVFIFISLITLSSCVTYQKCFDKFGTLEQGKKISAQHVLDTTLTAFTKPDSLQGSIDADTLIHLVQQLQQVKGRHDSLLTVTKNQELQLNMWYDRKTNQIKYSANKKADTVRVPFHDTVRVVADCPPVVVFDPVEKLPWYAPLKLWEWLKLFAIWVLLGAVVVGFIYSKFKK